MVLRLTGVASSHMNIPWTSIRSSSGSREELRLKDSNVFGTLLFGLC
jgi:hypothetical protein